MSRYTGPKAKLCRKLGINIFGVPKYDKILAKKNYAPGMHGKNKFGKKSEYGKQLMEKQKAKFMFGINERQFRKYYVVANRKKGVTGDDLLITLEKRLDNILFRCGIAATRMQGRQMVNHGLIKVNGKRVTIPSILAKSGDKITVREKNINSKLFELTKKKKIKTPKWLKTDLKELKIEVIAEPDREDIEKTINSKLIVEYYSK